MGFLSKLLGSQVEKAVTGFAENVIKEANNKLSDSSKVENKAEAPSTGCSWGDKMPLEPNQYNYSGNYKQYFESIFADKLNAYRMEKEEGKWGNTIYTFYNAADKALVVEILPETSSTKKLRDACAKAGVPYLRFYHNHHGWWNTRSYVENRIAGALK